MSIQDIAEFIRHPRQQPTNLAFFNGFMYGLGLYAMVLLIPLYAISLGFRLSDQGIVIAAPAVFMIILRLPGGAISDRFGERVVIGFAFAALLTGALVAMVAKSMTALIVSQLCNGASRSVYWSAAQSYISRSAEGKAGVVMGRQLAFEFGAGIVGALAAGFVAELFGFRIAFGVIVVLCAIGLTVTSNLPPLPRKDQVRSILASFAAAKGMLFARPLIFAHFVAFVAASHAALMGGLFIAYFRHVGYSEGLTGMVNSLFGVGVVTAGYFFGGALARFGPKRTGGAGMVCLGALAAAVAATGNIPLVPVVLMMGAGVAFGTLRSLYPAITAQESVPHQRAMALAVVSLYWAIAMLLMPLVFGFIAQDTSIATAMTIFGGYMVTMGLLSPLVFAFGAHRPRGPNREKHS